MDFFRPQSILIWLASFLILSFSPAIYSQPEGFLDELIVDGFQDVNGITFDANGTLYAWEKRGLVHVIENGIQRANPLIDISEEVANFGDYGLLGLALDPDYLLNGYIYLFYVVDRHHLLYHNTPAYNANINVYFDATIGRITRYTVVAPSNPSFATVDYTSRKILLGEDASSGVPIVNTGHGTGTLLFGTDGTLLASIGDGTSSGDKDIGNGSADVNPPTGIDNDGPPVYPPSHEVGSFRCQLIDSYNGKIIRINPENGQGYPSNPFWTGNPDDVASKVWALGFRNPFRMTLKPGTGGHYPEEGNPGVIYVGEVGRHDYDELNIVNVPGQNFGWPAYEGMDEFSYFYTNNPLNDQTASSTAAFFDSYEGEGNTIASHWNKSGNDDAHRSDEAAHEGTKSMKFEIHADAAINFRDELVFKGSDSLGGQYREMQFGDEWWIGFSFYVPPTWQADVNGEIIFQVHGVPDDHDSQTVSTNPLYDIAIVENTMELRQKWSDQDPWVAKTYQLDTTIVIEDEIVPGKWYDFVHHYIVSKTDDGTGLIEMWLDNEKKYAHRGPNAFVDQVGPYIKYGIYKPFWKNQTRLNTSIANGITSRTYYHDNFRVFIGEKGYYAVMPQGAERVPYLGYPETSPNDLLAHESPTVEYAHSSPTTRVFSNGQVLTVGTDFPGEPSDANSSIGGTWYSGSDFPGEYRDAYFHSDYALRWIQRMEFDENDEPQNIEVFATGTTVGGVVDMETSPVQGGIFYVNYPNEVRRIYYSPGNYPPTAIADADTLFGAAPLTVNFTGSLSTDPENEPLSYEWKVDGQVISTLADPSYIFQSVDSSTQSFEVELIVTDNAGAKSTEELLVSVNNTPPEILSTSIDDVDFYSLSQTTLLNLEAVVSDAEHSDTELDYAWQTSLYHNTHNHPEPIDVNKVSTAVLTPIGCDGAFYWYRVTLTVTDPGGLFSTYIKDIYPQCEGGNLSPNAIISTPDTSGTYPFRLSLEGSASNDPDGMISSYHWDLGNGKTAMGANPTITFYQEGSFSIKLLTYDDRGASAEDSITVTVSGVGNIAPQALFTSSVDSGGAPLFLTVDASGANDPDGNIVSYNWDFGDGTTASGLTASHTFMLVGTNNVGLTVTDDEGETATSYQEIRVAVPNTVISLAPIEDAHTNSTQNTTNYGEEPFLRVKSGSTWGSRTYLKYDVSGIENASKVRLKLFGITATSDSEPMWVTIFGTSTNWSENSITYNNAPSTNTVPLATVYLGESAKYYDLDLSVYANQINVNNTISFAVYPESGGDSLTFIRSRESETPALLEIIETDTLNVLPTAVILSDTLEGEVPLTINFDGTSSSDSDGLVVSYNWDFDNGQESTDPSPSITFEEVGTYEVKLLILDNLGGADWASQTIQVSHTNVLDFSPIAEIEATPTEGEYPLTVSFSGSNSYDILGSIESYFWEFGDGDTLSGENVTHTYTLDSVFVARLTVTDNSGKQGSNTVLINVSSPPVLPFSIEQDSAGFWVKEMGEPVFFYQSAPKSDSLGQYTRNNYLHPVFDLDGQVITEDFPGDHPHHRGIFWAWHRVMVNGDKKGDMWDCVDFAWDIQSVEDTSTLDLAQISTTVHWKSPEYTDGNNVELPIVEEKAKITVYPSTADYRAIDFEISLLSLVAGGIELGASTNEAAYGGFSTRIHVPDDLVFTSTSGEVFVEENQKLAIEDGPWMDIFGSIAEDSSTSGITYLTHPDNPEPQNLWHLRRKKAHQGEDFPGPDFADISDQVPTVLRYRLIIHEGNIDQQVLYNQYIGNVEKLDQQISFEPISNKAPSAVPFDLVATSSANLPISFELVSGPANLNGHTVTLTGDLGQVVLRAWQPGNENYHPSDTIEQSFFVLNLTNTDSLILVMEDAYVNLAKPNDNYGNAGALSLKDNGSYTHKSYFKFDLSGIEDVVSATLKIYSESGSNEIAVQVLGTANTWQESTINGNNAPAQNTGVLAQGVIDNALGYIEFDVASYVVGFAGQEAEVAFILESNNGNKDKGSVLSKEGNAPAELFIVKQEEAENAPPVAMFSTSVEEGRVPLTIDVDGSGSFDIDGTILGYEWDLGQGFLSNAVSTSFTFNEAGSYSLQLIVTDDLGEKDSVSKTIVVLPPNIEPTALILADPDTGEVPLTVSFDGSTSTDQDGSIISYAWDFGDGNQSSLVNPVHEYVNTGEFDVRLVVMDSDSTTDTTFHHILVLPQNILPSANFVSDTYEGPLELTVNLDASGSVDMDGSIVTYEWDLGDGNTGTGNVIQHTFDSTGYYSIRLVVTDDRGGRDTTTHMITVTTTDGRPIAMGDLDIFSGKAPLLVGFDGSGSYDIGGNIESYFWDFGDGSSAPLAITAHPYTSEGNYTAKLIVTDNDGKQDTAELVIDVFPPNVPPTANILLDTTMGHAPLSVQFDASGSTDSDGTIERNSWTLGDGNTSDVQAFTHVFASEGTYAVQLIVEDNDGAKDTSSVIVSVLPPNQAPVATFSATPESGIAPLEVDFDANASSDSDGTIVSFQWDLGDGQTTTGPVLSHVYPAPGQYNVILTITDDDGAIQEASKTITVNPNISPETTLTVLEDAYIRLANGDNNYGGAAELRLKNNGNYSHVSFIKFAANTDWVVNSAKLVLYPNSDSKVISINILETDNTWSENTITANTAPDGGNVIATIDIANVNDPLEIDVSAYVVAQLANQGDIAFRLESANNNKDVGLLGTKENGNPSQLIINEGVVIPNIPPVASIASINTGGTAPFSVSLDGSGSTDVDGNIVSYNWDFGDGNGALGQVVNYTFNDPGDFAVTLTVQDDDGDIGTQAVDLNILPANFPPIASIQATPLSGLVPLEVDFDASASSDSDGSIVSYDWNLGDGNSSSDISFLHTYTEIGVYDVQLILTDDLGAKDTAEVQVEVLAPNVLPTASFTFLPTELEVNASINFDASSSVDSDGNIGSYIWDFGDGSQAAGVLANHSYVLSGTFTVALIVEDERGGRDTAEQAVVVLPENILPIASFVANPDTGEVPFLVSFDPSTSLDSDGTIDSYAWEFGEGSTSSIQTPTFTYTNIGVFEAKLVITDDRGGKDSTTRTIVVTTPGGKPVAQASATPLSGKAPLDVVFTGENSYDIGGSIQSYTWDFGDGNVSNEANPNHQYTTQGSYASRLIVTDSEGNKDTAIVQIIVDPPNVAPVADFSATPTEGQAPLLVNFDAAPSSDVDGNILSYDWNFGDGGNATGSNPSYTYTTEGQYTASLTVTDNAGATHSSSQIISVESVALPVQTLDAVEDAYIRLSQSNSNYGSAGELRLKDNGTYSFQAFIKFDAGSPQVVNSAKLILYPLGGSKVINIGVLATSNAWSESTLTPSNAPSSDGALGTFSMENVTDPIEIDVTAYVTSGLQDQSIISFLIESVNGNKDVGLLGSKEGGNVAQLILNEGGTPQNLPPTADIFAAPVTGEAPLAVSFDGNGSNDPDGNIVAYTWTFGDGNSASGAIASHTYPVAGTYTATLQVEDNGGLVSSTSQEIIVSAPAGNIAPVASFTASPGSGTAPLLVDLDASSSSDSDGNIVAYEWDFGDGSSSTGPQLNHVYTTVGAFTIILTVRDNENASHTSTQVITVSDPSQQQELILEAVEDSYVKLASATSNFGAEDEIRLKNNGDFSFNGYMKFDAGGTLNISNARLVLYPSTATKLIAIDVFGTSNLWQELNIVANNAPASTSTLGTVNLLNTSSPVEVDVTNYVSDLLSLQNSVSFRLESGNPNKDLGILRTKEEGNPAELVLTVQSGGLTQRVGRKLEDVSKLTTIQIHPNPFENTLFIDLGPDQYERLEISLLNYLGERINFWKYDEIKGTIKLGPMEHLSEGFYFLIIESGNMKERFKMVKQK